MQVVLFCGGQGTRLREETESRPKPMVPIGGRPILWHILKYYAHFGHRDSVLCLGYKGEAIREYILNYRAMNGDCTVQLGGKESHLYHDEAEEQHLNVTLADTGAQSMTGHRLWQVRRHIQGDTFLATYGDGLCDVDLDALVQYHFSHGKIATVTAPRIISRFGILGIADDDTVESFNEKPESDARINGGYIVFNTRVFDYLSDDPSLVLEQHVLPKLAADGELKAFKHDGFFYAMDTYREYIHLNELWDGGNAPWAVWNPHAMLNCPCPTPQTSGAIAPFSSRAVAG